MLITCSILWIQTLHEQCLHCYVVLGIQVKAHLRSTEIKTEADVGDDMPKPCLCTVCHKRFTTKGH